MFARGNFTWGGGMVRMAHLQPPLVEHWNTQNWSLVKMLPTNNLGRIGRQLILLDKTLSGKYAPAPSADLSRAPSRTERRA